MKTFQHEEGVEKKTSESKKIVHQKILHGYQDEGHLPSPVRTPSISTLSW